MPQTILLIVFLLSVLSIKCQNGPALEKKHDCRNEFLGASDALNLYYSTDDAKYLDSALIQIDLADDSCLKKDIAVVQFKLGILILQKNYQTGLQYLRELDGAVFERNYEKRLYENTFKAIEHIGHNDSLLAVSCLKNSISQIDAYISGHPGDKKAVMDYFSTKSIFESPQTLEDELVKKMESNPAEKDLYKAFKGTFNNSDIHDFYFHTDH